MLLPSLPQCWSWGLALCNSETGTFLRRWMYVCSVLPQSASLPRTPPPPFSQRVPNYKLEIQDGQGVGVEVIKLESLEFSPHQHILHLHRSAISTLTPTGAQLGVNGFDPTWFSPSARATVPFPKVAALTEMCSLACNLNDYYITGHFTSKQDQRPPTQPLFLLAHTVAEFTPKWL